MAIAQGNTVLNSDLQSYYTSFNSFINAYGGNITQLTMPAANKKVEAIDINNLNSKINEFQLDEYLGTQPTWWVNASVTIGDIIYATDVTGINTTISNMANVVCRNEATNNYSNYGQCCDSNNKSVCCNSNNKTVCCNSNNNNVCCNSNNNNVCCNSNNKSVSCSNGSYSYIMGNGTSSAYDNNISGRYLTNNRSAAGGWSGSSCGKLCGHRAGGQTYECSAATCSVSCSGFTVQGQGTNSPYPKWGTCSVTCTYSSHNQTCNNSRHNQTCNNSRHNQSCNNSRHNQTCANSNHGQTCANSTHNQTCANSTNARTCSNTKTIDLTCNQSTKSNN